jgi:DNA polymerase-3 subunit alpha
MYRAIMTQKKFIHLRVHSDYSLLQSTLKLKEIIGLTQEEEMPAVAVTDLGNLFGALEFSQMASKANIQPIIGTELLIKRPRTGQIETEKNIYDTLVLLVQNDVGYKHLIKLVSHSHLSVKEQEEPHITLEQLEKHNQGLICLTASVQGALTKLFLSDNKADARAYITQLKALFPNRLYIELSRQGLTEEVEAEPFLLELALEHNLPIVATNPTFFANKAMHEAHTVLMCISDGTYISSEEKRLVSPESYFKSEDQMKQLFADLPEALENSTHIAQRCAFQVTPSPPMLPRYDSPSGLSEAEEMAKQCREGLNKRLENQIFRPGHSEDEKKRIRKPYDDRLVHELKIINQMGFDGYFLIVADFIKWAKSKNIPVGPGRGSGAGSIAAWALTITDIDPIRFNLLFERFLNPERISMPDFDIDFCQDRRDEVIQYVKNKYGLDKVAQIITFGKLQARAVVRDVGRVLQMPYGQVDRLCKMIPNNPADPITLPEALDKDPVLRRQAKNEPEVQRLLSIAIKLEGLYRHASTHAAGIIIGDRKLDEVIPLYRDPKSDMPVTQFSFKLVEQAGLVKFDFLGLKTLSIIEHAAQLVRQTYHPNFNISSIPFDDIKTFDLLKRVETTGVFQLESSGMRDVLKKLAPDQFEEITTLVALYRPGPMDDIPRYLACKHGEEEITYAHPMLKEILETSFGVMVYQEQVMQIAQKMGGYSMGSADLLRRAMGKKIKSEMDAQRALFVEGALKNGIQKEVANQIFDQMAKFAGYGFNKSHSAPYALLAYQTAYLKANYPVEFMASLMTYDLSNTDKLNLYRQELQKMGIAVLPPDVNHSKTLFSVENGALRYALAAIRNVGEHAMEELVEERHRNGPFESIWDFAERLSSKVINKRLLEKLIMAGAFDGLFSNRKALLDSLEEILNYGTNYRAHKNNSQKSLFGKNLIEQVPKITENAPWSETEKLSYEFEALGLYLSSHPVKTYMNHHKSCITSADLVDNIGKTVRLLGVISHVQTRIGKTGKKFAFISLTDEQGTYEVAVFGDKLYENQNLIEIGKVVEVTVEVRDNNGESPRLILISLQDVSIQKKNLPHKLTLVCQPTVEWDILFNHIKELINSEEGVPLVVSIIGEKNEILIETGEKIWPKQEVINCVLGLDGVIQIQ